MSSRNLGSLGELHGCLFVCDGNWLLKNQHLLGYGTLQYSYWLVANNSVGADARVSKVHQVHLLIMSWELSIFKLQGLTVLGFYVFCTLRIFQSESGKNVRHLKINKWNGCHVKWEC